VKRWTLRRLGTPENATSFDWECGVRKQCRGRIVTGMTEHKGNFFNFFKV
jgi:hypothetical protein